MSQITHHATPLQFNDLGVQAFKVAIAARHERHVRMLRGLGPATEQDQGSDGGGEGSQEDRMNELAAEKRRRRLKEARIN